jgi:hypothetical protein
VEKNEREKEKNEREKKYETGRERERVSLDGLDVQQ